MPRAIRLRVLATILALLNLAVPGCTLVQKDPAVSGAGNEVSQAPSVTTAEDSSATSQEIRPADAAALHAAVGAPGAKATLLNVWATWCAPCREEFPELVRLEKAWRDRGLRVMFVSADFDDQLPEVRAFLAKQGVTAPSWIKTGDDMAFIDAMDKRWSGALPATFIYDSQGKLVRFWEGKADYARFESEVRAVMESAAKPS